MRSFLSAARDASIAPTAARPGGKQMIGKNELKNSLCWGGIEGDIIWEGKIGRKIRNTYDGAERDQE